MHYNRCQGDTSTFGRAQSDHRRCLVRFPFSCLPPFLHSRNRPLPGFGRLPYALVVLFTFVQLISISSCQPPHLSVARSYLAAAGAGNKLVFAGGLTSTGTSSVVDIYDVLTQAWNSSSTGAGQLSVARAHLAAASAGNRIVFAGGLYVPEFSHEL